MKRIFMLTLALFLAGCTIYDMEYLQMSEVSIPPYKTFLLENGLKVVLMEYHRLPIIEMQVTVRGGTSIDPDTLVGIAQMTAALLNQGTTTRTAMQIAEQLDFMGASLTINATEDCFSVGTEFLKNDFDKGMDLLSDILRHPNFPQEEIEREQFRRITALEKMKEDPQIIADIYAKKLMYGTHPYGNQSFGTVSSLHKITKDELTKFYSSVFTPNNAFLVVVGDFSTDEMLGKIKLTLGKWRRTTPPNLPSLIPEFNKGRSIVLINKPDATQSHIRIAHLGIDTKNPDRIALEVANAIFSSRLISRLADERKINRDIATDISSNFQSNALGGSYLISTSTKNVAAHKTIAIALDETKKLLIGGAGERDLEKAKNSIVGNFSRSLQAPENLTARLSTTFYYGLPEDYLQTYIKKVKNVTLGDVNRVIDKYFPANDLVIMVVTNPMETRADLEDLGTLKEISVEKAID
jgi:zinc protease